MDIVAIMLFTQQVFHSQCFFPLLAAFNTWDNYYFQSNLSLVWYAKVLLIKKEKGCSVVLQSSKHEEITFPHKFILYLPRLPLGQYCQENIVNGSGFSEIIQRGDCRMGKIVYGRRVSNLSHTMIHKFVVIR